MAVASVISKTTYKNRSATQNASPPLLTGPFLQKYEVWTVKIDYFKEDIKEIKLEWKTSGDLFGHILGSVKVAPIHIPSTVKSNIFEAGERVVVMLHKVKVITADSEVVQVKNKVIEKGKAFYFLKKWKGGRDHRFPNNFP